MSRRRVFETEAAGGIRGLGALTEPAPDEDVAGVVDVAVVGARGDGKTQFIVHAIRTLRAYAPLLSGAEHRHNRDVLEVVMNARAPSPDATAPGTVPHYVFRARPETLLAHVGLAGRLWLLARAGGLVSLLALAAVNASLVTGALAWLRGGLDPAAAGAGGGLLALGAALAWGLSRRHIRRAGEVEIVFWDVAGEHVYADSAADYYGFLGALVRERRRRARRGRRYAFAPVLICNPLSLGTSAEGSAYARLRQLVPLFASINVPAPRALVAINRWAVVDEICQPDADRDEVVALVPRRRDDDDDTAPDPPQAGSLGPLPLVRRDVVRRHCLDAEDARDVDVALSFARYDAGVESTFTEERWDGWDELPAEVRARWRAPSAGEPRRVLHYEYADGPGSFGGEARRVFLRWLAGLAYGAPAPRGAPERADDRAEERANEGEPEPGGAREPADPWREPTSPGLGDPAAAPGRTPAETEPAVPQIRPALGADDFAALRGSARPPTGGFRGGT